MPKLGFPNCFIINNIKKKCCTSFANKELYDLVANAFGCLHELGTYQPTILSNNNVLTHGTI